MANDELEQMAKEMHAEYYFGSSFEWNTEHPDIKSRWIELAKWVKSKIIQAQIEESIYWKYRNENEAETRIRKLESMLQGEKQ